MKHYRYLLILIAVSVFFNFNSANASVFAKKEVYECGKQPVFLFSNTPNSAPKPFIICAGYDANFNDTINAGDELPSVYIFKKTGETPVKKMADLDLLTLFSVRPAVDDMKDITYIPNKNYIYKYSSSMFNKKLDSIYCPSVRAAAVDKNYIYATSGSYGKQGIIRKYEKGTYKQVDSLPAGMYPHDIIVLDENTIAYISEGSGAAYDGNVTIVNNGDKLSQIKEIVTGNTANHLAVCGNYLYITNNYSHTVSIVDWKAQKLVDSIKIPTTGYNGPRETLIINTTDAKDYKAYQFYTTAYDGKVYYGVGTEITETSENNNKKRETVCLFPGIGIVVSDVSNSDYTPANTITVYNSDSRVQNKELVGVSIYPNPVSSEINMQFSDVENACCSVNIYDASGRMLSDLNTNILSGKLNYNISNLNLLNGAYYIRVISGNKVYYSSFIIK